MMTQYFNVSSSLIDYAFTLQKSAAAAAIQDVWHRLAYAWVYQDFENSITSTIVRELDPDMISTGIIPFIEQRYTTAMEQIHQMRSWSPE